MADTSVQLPLRVLEVNGVSGIMTLIAGTSITLTVDTTASTITINSTATGSGSGNSYNPGGW